MSCEETNQVLDILSNVSASTDREDLLQSALESLFTKAGLSFVREYVLSDKDRIDFFFPASGLGVEVKVKGGLNSVTRQVFRYLKSDEVNSVLLCSTRRTHGAIARKMAGKQVYFVCLSQL